MEDPIEDYAHLDIGFMIMGEDGELLADIIEHLGYLYDMYVCNHDVAPSMLFMHPEDYNLLRKHCGTDKKIATFEDVCLEVDSRVPRWNYYFL